MTWVRAEGVWNSFLVVLRLPGGHVPDKERNRTQDDKNNRKINTEEDERKVN